jgi:hypothetical protein
LGVVFDARSDSIKDPEGKDGQSENEEESGEHGESDDGEIGIRDSGFCSRFSEGRVEWGGVWKVIGD